MTPSASSDPANPPQCHCRICDQVMAAKFQQGTARIPGHFIVTCANPVCWMQDYTFSELVYPSVDLALYRAAV